MVLLEKKKDIYLRMYVFILFLTRECIKFCQIGIDEKFKLKNLNKLDEHIMQVIGEVNIEFSVLICM